MRRDDIIAEAVRIVKSNTKYYKTAYENNKGLYDVITESKTFSIDNVDNYSMGEIKEIFEKKGYTVSNILPIDFALPGYTYLRIEEVPEQSPSPSPVPSSPSPSSKRDESTRVIPDSDDAEKTFYYKVSTNYGVILLKNNSQRAYGLSEIKRVIRLNLRDVEISDFDSNINNPHEGIDESRYETFEQFLRSPRIFSEETPLHNVELDKILKSPASMDPPQDPIRAAFNMKDLEYLPEEDKRKILGHKTDYWTAHKKFTGMLRAMRITPTTTVASLPENKKEKGAELIRLLDEVIDGQLSQVKFIQRVNRLDDVADQIESFNAAKIDLASAFKDLFSRKRKKE